LTRVEWKFPAGFVLQIFVEESDLAWNEETGDRVTLTHAGVHLIVMTRTLV
jgi:hypothetical protein